MTRLGKNSFCGIPELALTVAAESFKMRLAAVDIGTVTTRLLITEAGDGDIVELHREVNITQLGEHLAENGRLNPKGLSAVLDALASYAQLCEQWHVERVRAVATSAARDATDAEALFAGARKRGFTVEIISGDEEARLSFVGATWGRAGSGLCVMDPGGGSTEYVLGRVDGAGAVGARVDFARSLNIGSRRLTDMFVASDPPTPGELARVTQYVDAALAPVADELRGRVREVIAVAGTATPMVTVKYGIEPYNPARVHGQVITTADLDLLVGALARVPLAERQTIPGLEPDRAEVIVVGALILQRSLAALEMPAFTASDTDLLYGIIQSIAE
ncbi:MAG: Ppx/GppA family phosphatase [Actinomycetes bacterium]|jgi:exopolyphosphatase/guanosine-5'-triphosphate,3'-diphosphate pyrophosphatase|nr:Ppx/GppA family phosphatase [Actinomycetes bacterium]